MINRSYPQGVPISIKYPEIPVYSFLENNARKYPSRPGLIFYGNKMTYKKIWDEALIIAHSLQKLGLKHGDRVGLLLPNSPQFLITFNSIFIAGGIAVPINPLNPISEIKRELEHTECLILIVLDRLLEKIPTDYSGIVIISRADYYAAWFYKIANKILSKQSPNRTLLKFENLLNETPINQIEKFNVKEETAVIIHTSGTTGDPKGVMLTHYNLVVNALQSYHWLRGWGYSSKPQKLGWPIILCAVPFFHSYGLNILNEALSYGCTLALIPDPKPKAILNMIQKYEVTHLPLIPRFVSEILNYEELSKINLQSVTMCSSGGAAILPEVMKKFEKLTNCRFYQGYGLTEGGPVTHATPVEGNPNYLSPGFPYPDTLAKIVDLQLGEVDMPPNTEGELIVRGPQIMKGYWKLPDETSKVLREGWLFTGDIAKIDEEGWLYIIGRKRDRIISNGHSVWPTKIEEIIQQYQDVENVIVFGTPDPLRCSTDIQAFIVPKKNATVDGLEEKILKYCNEKLQPYERPTKIEIVSHLPMTQMGKVDRLAVEAEIEKKFREYV